MRPDPAPPRGRSISGTPWPDLAKRAVSGLVLALLAIGADWFGGWPFAVFWGIAAIIVLIEWETIVVGGRRSIAVGGLAVAAAVAMAAADRPLASPVPVLIGAIAVYLLRQREPTARLAALGVLYAGAIAVPIILLRNSPTHGSDAVLFLFAIVWGTDVMAYFTGRTLGGPKLWPRVSPKKTWSGFVGGAISGAAAGWMVLAWCGVPVPPVLIAIALVLAVASQGGDLLESALKRRFGAKDTSRLIPGHGGVMDRLDGFVAAATIAALIGLLREPGDLAAGLVTW